MMQSVAEMLIEADRTATSDADLRVKVALILEYARAEALLKSTPRAECDDCKWSGLMSELLVESSRRGPLCPECASTAIREDLPAHA